MENKRVPLMRRYGSIFGIAGFFFALFFQNCDGGFHYNPTSGQISSTGSLGSEEFRLTTFNPSGLVVNEGQPFEGGLDYKVVASGTDIPNATLLWELTGNTGGCVLKAGTGPEIRYVNCTKTGAVSVKASAVWTDGTTSVLSSPRSTTELVADACGPSSNTRNVFRIPNGTNSSPWNSSASPVVIFVGQVLRICNDDAIAHQLHTDGNPCAHQGATMAKGQFYDCQVNSLNGRNATTGLFPTLYDHVAGTNAAFYVRPYDGAALYADVTNSTSGDRSCATCHGAYANSQKPRRTFQQIKSAIASVPAMAILQDQNLLTDDEIRAIAFSLSLL